MTMYYIIFGKKYTEIHQYINFFIKKVDFEPQYFTFRTIKKHGNFTIQNVLRISPNLKLTILINFVI